MKADKHQNKKWHVFVTNNPYWMHNLRSFRYQWQARVFAHRVRHFVRKGNYLVISHNPYPGISMFIDAMELEITKSLYVPKERFCPETKKTL